MCVGLRVFGASDQHLSRREDALQFGNERDGAALTLVNGFHTERLGHGFQRILGGDGGRVHGPTHAVFATLDSDLGTERRVGFKERGQGFLCFFRALGGRGTQRQTETSLRGHHIEGAFDRVRVEADHGHGRLGPQAGSQRTGAGELVAGNHTGILTHGGLVEVALQAADRLFGSHAGHSQIAVLVIHGGDKQGGQRIGIEDRATILAGVHWVFKTLDGHIHAGIAAKRGGQGGNIGRPVAGIGHDDDVGGKLVLVGFDERDEARRAHLLFAFDEHLDIDLEVIAEGLQRAGMDGNAAAIIGGTTAIEAAIDLSGHERVGVPFGRIRHGLHVMVCVQQHGGRIRVHDV